MNLQSTVSSLLAYAGMQLNQFAEKLSDDRQTDQSIDRSFAFSFGDPEPILSNNLSPLLTSFVSAGGQYYTPPVDLAGLARLMRANPYHGPILYFKRNMICKWFQPSALLSQAVIERAALDYVVTGNMYFQRFYDKFGRVVRLGYLPAVYMRKSAVADDQYVQLVPYSPVGRIWGVPFEPGEVVHLQEFELEQSRYGLPQYLGGINNVLLGEASVLFKRKFFQNGAHVGNIFVTHDANINPETEKQLENAIKEGKGAGNFRSIYLNVPKSSSREPVKVIPVGNIGTADEYKAISEINEMAMLAMHRVPPNLAAIIPANNGGFGDLIKTLQAYHELEVQPLQLKFLQLNEVVGGNPVVFIKPDWGLGV